MDAATAFALASALHAGFQVTVTALVYPALADRPAEDWRRVHARHSRTILPIVVMTYLALGVTGAATLLAGPGVSGWVALAGATLAVGTTALAAAPAHGRLLDHDADTVDRLLAADRWRCAAAVVGAVAAVVAAA